MRAVHVYLFGKVALLVLVVASLIELGGCRFFSRPQGPIEPAKLPYKVNGAKDSEIIRLQKKFNKEGIRVISVGQDYLLSITSSHLFFRESPQLTWESYALLNAVACYLKEFRKVAIHITAYSNKCVSVRRELSLTQARARAVGNYLWSQGIDSRFIFTQGLGSDKPIVNLTENDDKSPNSRVEITFRDAVA